jgi:hypothetical protein
MTILCKGARGRGSSRDPLWVRLGGERLGGAARAFDERGEADEKASRLARYLGCGAELRRGGATRAAQARQSGGGVPCRERCSSHLGLERHSTACCD